MKQLVSAWVASLEKASGGLVSEACFQSSASEEAIAAVEEALGVVLPEDFKAFYRIYNGVAPTPGYYLLEGYEWLSIEECLQTWQQWSENNFNDGMETMTEDYANDEGIVPLIHAKKWLPFGNDNGYFLLLDLEPAENGHYGQILCLSGDGEPTTLLAPSMKAWLKRYQKEIEAGVWVFDEAYHGMVSAAELAESEAIQYEKETQTGRFAPEVLAQQQAQMLSMEEQVKLALGDEMWQMLFHQTKQ